MSSVVGGEGGVFNGLVCHQLCGWRGWGILQFGVSSIVWVERAEHLTVSCVISCVGGEGGAFNGLGCHQLCGCIGLGFWRSGSVASFFFF